MCFLGLLCINAALIWRSVCFAIDVAGRLALILYRVEIPLVFLNVIVSFE